MATDKAERGARTTEIRRVVTADARPTEKRSLQDVKLSTDTTPSGRRVPVPPPPPPAPAPVATQGGGDE